MYWIYKKHFDTYVKLVNYLNMISLILFVNLRPVVTRNILSKSFIGRFKRILC